MKFRSFFRSLNDKEYDRGQLYRVEIGHMYALYDADPWSDFTLAGEPFTVKYKRDFTDNCLYGIVKSTATVRIVTDDVRQFFQRQTVKDPIIVRLLKSTTDKPTDNLADYTVEWMGVLSNNNFQSGWDSPLNEFSLNADCLLSSPLLHVHDEYGVNDVYDYKAEVEGKNYLEFKDLFRLSYYPINKVCLPYHKFRGNNYDIVILVEDGIKGKTYGELFQLYAEALQCYVTIDKDALVFVDTVAKANTEYGDEIVWMREKWSDKLQDSLVMQNTPITTRIARKAVLEAGDYFNSTISYSDTSGCEMDIEMTSEIDINAIELTTDKEAFDLRGFKNDMRDYRGRIQNDRELKGHLICLDDGAYNDAQIPTQFGKGATEIESLGGIIEGHGYQHDYTIHEQSTYTIKAKSIPKYLATYHHDGFMGANIGFLGTTVKDYMYTNNGKSFDLIDFCTTKNQGLATVYHYAESIDKDTYHTVRQTIEEEEWDIFRTEFPTFNYPSKTLSKGLAIKQATTNRNDLLHQFYSERVFCPKGCLISLDVKTRISLCRHYDELEPDSVIDFMSAIPSEFNGKIYDDIKVSTLRGLEEANPYLTTPLSVWMSGYGFESQWLNSDYDVRATDDKYVRCHPNNGIQCAKPETNMGNTPLAAMSMHQELIALYEWVVRDGVNENCFIAPTLNDNYNGGFGRVTFSFYNPSKTFRHVGVDKEKVYVETYLFDNLNVKVMGEQGSLHIDMNNDDEPYYNDTKRKKIRFRHFHENGGQSNSVNQIIAHNQGLTSESIDLGYNFLNYKDLQNWWYHYNFYSDKVMEHTFEHCGLISPSDLVKIIPNERCQMRGVFSIKELDVDYGWEHSTVTSILEPNLEQPIYEPSAFLNKTNATLTSGQGFERELRPKRNYNTIVPQEQWITDDRFSHGELKVKEDYDEETLETQGASVCHRIFIDVFDVEDGELCVTYPQIIDNESLSPNYTILGDELWYNNRYNNGDNN